MNGQARDVENRIRMCQNSSLLLMCDKTALDTPNEVTLTRATIQDSSTLTNKPSLSLYHHHPTRCYCCRLLGTLFLFGKRKFVICDKETSRFNHSIADRPLRHPSWYDVNTAWKFQLHFYILSPGPARFFHINSIYIEVLCSIYHSPCQLWTRIILVRRLQSFSIWKIWLRPKLCSRQAYYARSAWACKWPQHWLYRRSTRGRYLCVYTGAFVSYRSHRSVDKRRLTQILFD